MSRCLCGKFVISAACVASLGWMSRGTLRVKDCVEYCCFCFELFAYMFDVYLTFYLLIVKRVYVKVLFYCFYVFLYVYFFSNSSNVFSFIPPCT